MNINSNRKSRLIPFAWVLASLGGEDSHKPKQNMKTLSNFKFRSQLTVLLLVAASGALLAPSSTLAQANWLQYQFAIQVDGGPSNPNYDSGLVQNTGLLTTNIAIIPNGQNNAYANASISYGGLGLNAGSAVNNSPSDGDGWGATFGPSVGGGWDIAFQDTLTLTSPTLPANSPVQVQVACVYTSSSSPGISINRFDSASDGGSVGIQVLAYAGYHTVTAPVGGTLQTNTLTNVFSAWTGGNMASDGFVMTPSITLYGGVEDVDGLSMSFSVAASVASQTYVDILTPGVSYTSASGTVYPTLLSAAPPMLSIQPAANGVTLFWPVTTDTYRLQQATDLTIANWVSNTIPINVVNGTNQVIVAPAIGNMFFRLINP